MAREHRARANGHIYRQTKARFVARAEPVCGVCGGPVDKTLPWPHPLSPSVDHIIPLAHGGRAMDVNGWQLAHLKCNRWKSDQLPGMTVPDSECGWIDHWSRIWYGNATPCPIGRGYHPNRATNELLT